MSDAIDERQAIQLLVGGFVGLFLISLFQSSTEIRFWISGVDQEVVIYATYDYNTGSHRNRWSVVLAEFSVINAQNRPHECAIEFPQSCIPPPHHKHLLTYLPGHELMSVRPGDERNWLWPLVCFYLLGVVAFKG